MSALRLACCLMLCSLSLQAAEFRNEKLSSLIAGQHRPDGVVFEILSWTDNSWDWAAPMLRQYVDQLRAAYPDLDIALVSQGVELFDLALGSSQQGSPALSELMALNAEGMAIHISGDYAKWKRMGSSDFPGFVDVVDSSAAQLEDYIKLGFVPIMLEAPHAVD